MNTISKLYQKLCNTEYRKGFVQAQMDIGIPSQIRALLRSRKGWTQETLADRAGMLQPRISALMTPGKTSPSISTLRRIAEAFDCALMVKFVPFSELARWTDEFDPEAFVVPPFGEDTGFDQTTAPKSAAPSSVAQAIGANSVGTLQMHVATASHATFRIPRAAIIAPEGAAFSVPAFAPSIRSVRGRNVSPTLRKPPVMLAATTTGVRYAK